MNDYKLNTKYKDRLFRLIFREKKELLELYNALNESNYTNPEDLKITTIEDVVYMGMKNDLSFIIGDEMNLYEHQSTFCPNLPLRGLFYFSSLYKAYVEPIKHRLYSTSELKIPFPQYIVFYNGIEIKPERREAVEQAIDECIRNDILAEILRKNRSEIVDSILTEWDENEYREFLKEESWNEGHQAGKKVGMRDGEIIGIVKTCQEFHASREDTLEKIQKEFLLEREEAERYIKEYWK